MAAYTTDNIRVLSVEPGKSKHGGANGLFVRLAMLQSGSEPEILLETTRFVESKYFDDADAVKVARHWFHALCKLGAEAMQPFELPKEQFEALKKVT